MSLQHLSKAALRGAKNYTKGYSDVQAKVRDATSNDPWGPSGTQMNEIAQLTYDQHQFVEIMEMLDKRLNDKGKNWRHVFKALTVLDYCLHAGSENVVLYFRDNLYVIKTLREFQYIDEDMKDQGANVRQKAKDITNLLQDEARLREQRRSRAHMRDRMVGGVAGSENGAYDEDQENENIRRRSRSVPPSSGSRRKKDDEELKRAIEASKRTLEEEQARRGGQLTSEEKDIAKAMQLSKEEEEKRLKSLEEANARALFEESTQPAPSSSNGFPLIDATSAPPNPMNLQPQFTAANPYFQLQQQQELAQQQAQAQAQYEWMLMQQQQAQQQAQAQAQQQAMLRAQQEEWMRQQMLQQQQQQQLLAQQQAQMQQQLFSPPLQVQPTGYASNNPFAMAATGGGSAFGSGAFGGGATNGSAFGGLTVPGGGLTSPSPQVQQRTPSPTPKQQTQTPSPTLANTLANARRPMNPSDNQHAHLASLFANRDDGLDSFGNTGQLRFGHNYASQLATQPTGSTNPFGAPKTAQQQQQNDQPFFSI